MADKFNNEQAEGEDQPLSKTARKKQMQALQTLGERLVPLKAEKLAQLPISETLLDAINLAKKTKQGNGQRRQLQFIGKLMRSEDHEAIERALKRLK